MRTISNDFNILFMCSICNFLHWKDLSRPIDQVCYMNDLCSGGKCIGIHFYDIIIIFYRKWKIDPYQFYTLSFFALFPGVDHIGIVLFCQNNFIAGLKIQTKNDRIQAFS